VPWAIGLEDERRPTGDPDRVLRVLEFPLGTDRLGIATSTTLKRRWAQGRRHHVIDPRTGSMSTSPLVQVTVVAASSYEAETHATTALLLDPQKAAGWLDEHGMTGILLTETNEIHTDEERNDG
jgi:thiamine biosynthesis lipoprotein